MSHLAMDWATAAPVADVFERAILQVLANHADSGGRALSSVSVDTLAAVARCDGDAVRQHLAAMVDRGLIAHGNREGAYDLLIPYSWYTGGLITPINRLRALAGREPLTPENRPPIPSGGDA